MSFLAIARIFTKGICNGKQGLGVRRPCTCGYTRKADTAWKRWIDEPIDDTHAGRAPLPLRSSLFSVVIWVPALWCHSNIKGAVKACREWEVWPPVRQHPHGVFDQQKVALMSRHLPTNIDQATHRINAPYEAVLHGSPFPTHSARKFFAFENFARILLNQNTYNTKE
jgi:hypothetical protein